MEEVVHPPVVDRVRIAVRERPVADEDLPAVQVRLRTDEDKLVAFAPGANTGLMYDYDCCYPQNARQDDLFRTIGLEMVDVTMGGLSSNCVCFGLADTGKTHTMFGSPNEAGLIQDTVRELFRRLEEQADKHEYEVSLQYWEMSRDLVLDNLADELENKMFDSSSKYIHASSNHSIFRDSFGRLYVSRLREVEIRNFEEFERYLNEGNERRIARGYDRMARWHGFVQVSVITTDKARGERCVLRNMTFVHMKGPDRVGEKGVRGDALRESSHINVGVTLLCAGIIHSLEYREKRKGSVRTKEEAHELIRKSESFFMECRFSQMMSQLICGHEASFVLGCVDPLSYGETIDTLENLQLFRQLTCSCIPIIAPSEKGRLLRQLRQLERKYGTAEELSALYNNSTGRPLSEEEEKIIRLRALIEGREVQDDSEAKAHEEELKQRSRARNADAKAGTGGTHGDHKKIYLNAGKTSTYEGQWADGLFDGYGEHIEANFKYKGEFRRGKREGEGTLFIRASGSAPYVRVYQGEWLNNMRDGHGTQWSKNGEVYEGHFVANQRHGHGKLYMTDGNVMEGNFSHGSCEGWAIMRTPNGDWYEGNWFDGKKEGPGVYHYVHRKQCLQGEWHQDMCRLGTMKDEPDKETNAYGTYIPRLELQDYEEVLRQESAKLSEQRARFFRSKNIAYTEPPKPSAAGGSNGLEVE